MKRTIGALLLALGLTLGLVVPPVALAAPDDQVKGKSCADITAEAPAYTTSGGAHPAAGVGLVDTAKPSCIGVTYFLRVYTTAGVHIGTGSFEGDGVTGVGESIQLIAPVTTGTPPADACLVFTSESGGRVIDQAPNTADTECAVGAYFLLDGGTGARSMK